MASRGNRNLSSLDNFMLDYYIVRYTEISNRINELYSELHSIHENIENIHENNRNEPFYSHNQRRTRTQPRRNSIPRANYSPLSPDPRNENSIQGPRNDVRNLFSNFFTNVPVVPTAQQIAQSTHIVQYGTINNPLNEACPISLERFRNEDLITQINHCGHLFNSEEVIEWFQNNVRCPVCRYDIRNYLPQQEQEEEPEPQPLTTTPTNNSSIIDRITQQLLVSFLNNSDDRIVFDASNNIFVYESTFHTDV